MRTAVALVAVLALLLGGAVPGEVAPPVGRGDGTMAEAEAGRWGGHGGTGGHGHGGGGHGHGGHWHGGGHWRGGCCWWGGAFIGGFAFGVGATALAYPWSYPYYGDPYYGDPYDSYPYPSSVSQVAAPPVASPPPIVQREVVFPAGRYVLYGDGVNQPWQWIWFPAATLPSAPPQ